VRNGQVWEINEVLGKVGDGGEGRGAGMRICVVRTRRLG
jgi:hypothetical protein